MSTLELENIKHPDNSGDNIALASNGSITIDRKSTDGTITEFRKDGTAVGNIATSSGRTSIGSGTNASGVRFDGSGLTPFYNNAVADGTVDLGYSGGRFNNVYLSGGVYLGGLVGANKLDDYEEGTWTPSFVSGQAPDGTVSSLAGQYVKVGKLVTLYMQVTGSSLNLTNYVRVQGIPFGASTSNASGTYILGGITSRVHGWTTLASGTTQWYFSTSGTASAASFTASVTYKI